MTGAPTLTRGAQLLAAHEVKCQALKERQRAALRRRREKETAAQRAQGGKRPWDAGKLRAEAAGALAEAEEAEARFVQGRQELDEALVAESGDLLREVDKLLFDAWREQASNAARLWASSSRMSEVVKEARSVSRGLAAASLRARKPPIGEMTVGSPWSGGPIVAEAAVLFLGSARHFELLARAGVPDVVTVEWFTTRARQSAFAPSKP